MGKKRKPKKPQPRRRPQPESYDAAWQSPSAKRWVQSVVDDMEPKLAGSAFAMSLLPPDKDGDRTGDVKYWVELGASIMMNKPIIAVVFDDQPIPEKLKLVADEIVRCPRGVDPEATEKLTAAMQRVVKRLDGQAAA